MTTLKFYGHACFQLNSERHSLLFDPFLKDNPFQVQRPETIDCNYILVSHAHYDHLGDTFAIAKRTGATVISTAEVANLCSEQGCSSHAMHIGGKHAFDFGSVRVTLAFHGAGAPGGHACGFVVNIGDKAVYFAGDTGLFGDMALLGQREKIDYALLPIGDNFTMGPDDAEEAVALLKPRFVVPMHYNTWPLIAQSAEKFKEKVEKRLNIPVIILKPGGKLDLV